MSGKIETKVSKNSLKSRGSVEKKGTHLYLHDRYLKEIPKISNPHSYLVIYLHNNEISEICNLNNALNLTDLYLQKNRIAKITQLDSLSNLKKLYLGHNMISVVEGLERLENLEELYLEKQFLPEGNFLCFDPRTIYGISGNLQILNISHNKIQSISMLAPLRFLSVLNASYNDLSDINEVCDVIRNWCFIREVNFVNNPLTAERLYREWIIANTNCLDTLDGKDISDSTRAFLKKLHRERLGKNLKPCLNLAQKIGDFQRYPSSIQKAVSACVLSNNKDLIGDSEIFDERNAVYIPWKNLPKSQIGPRLRILKRHTATKMKNNTNKNINRVANKFAHLQI